MSIDLGRRLIAAGLVPPEEVEAALFVSVARGVPFARVLIDRGAITERGLEEELERLGGLGLRQVAGAAELVARLPRAMCRRLAALPTRIDPHTGAIDVAAADPLDPHVAVEFGFHLGASVRVVRAPIAAIEEAIRRLELDEPEPPGRPRERRKTPPFPHGAPQSSVPPPVLDEAPIPLVRKAHGTRETIPVEGPAPKPLDGAGNRKTSPHAARGSGAGAPVSSTPFNMGAIGEGPVTPHPGTIRPERPFDEHAAPVAAPPPARVPSAETFARASSAEPPARSSSTETFARAPSADGFPRAAGAEPPAVSFPSLPPESGGRSTPPYGTPALAPPAPPVDLGSRGRAAQLPDEPTGRSATLPPEPDPEPQRVVRAPDPRPVLDGLERASSRDDVIRHALRGLRLVARRVGVFAVKRDGFHGWSCNVDLGDPDAFRELAVPIEQPSVLATAMATSIYLGRIPPTPAHEGLLAVMERASTDVAAVAARVAGRPVLVLFADDLEDTMTGTRYLIELAEAVGEALARVLTAR